MRNKVPEVKIRWRPQPRQMVFLEALGLGNFFGGRQGPPLARLVGYGGAAGGGKSDSLLMAGVLGCLTYPGCQVGYFRRTFPELDGPGGAIARSHQLLADLVRAKICRYQASNHRWLFINGSVLAFCHSQHETDVIKFQSQQFDMLLLDEGTHFVESMWNFLLTRNRSTGCGLPATIFAVATNPGGEGHYVFKNLFPDAGPVETVNEVYFNTAKITTYFIPAKLADNKVLEDRDPQYRLTLEALPEHLKRQMLEGDWDSFAGQAFSEWRREIHVCRPFAIPSYWKRWRANDPGYTDNFVWLWFAVDESGENVYVYREFTRANTDPKLAYSDQAARVAALSIVGGEIGLPDTAWDEAQETYVPRKEVCSFTVTGQDAFAKNVESGKCMVDYYAENGVADCIRPVHGPGSRATRKAVLHEYLKVIDGPEGKPTARLHVFDTCLKTIESLPMLVVEDHNPEVVADSPLDHWYDCLSYGVVAWHDTRSQAPPRPETENERIAKHKETLAKRLREKAMAW